MVLRRVAGWLAAQPGVAAVHYPGSNDAEHIFLGENRGGMVAFELANASQADVFRFLNALRLIKVATTLGDVHSLVLYPVMSSHRWVPAETRRELGISDGLLRLSVGIEDTSDIVGDLERGLRAVAQPNKGVS